MHNKGMIYELMFVIELTHAIWLRLIVTHSCINTNIDFYFVYTRTKIECVEYQNAVYESTFSTMGLNEPPIEQKIFRCSFSSVPLIVGGEKAQSKEFPHMVNWGNPMNFSFGKAKLRKYLW